MSHAKLSPSSAHRWMRCPGSVRICEGLPDTAGAAAREGTFAHRIGEKCLANGKDAAGWIGRTEAEFTADAAMTDAVQVYLEAVRTTMLAGGARRQELRIEHRVAAIPEVVYGTADALVFTDRCKGLEVFDYKHGAGVPVDVDDSEQLDIYAVGALEEFGGLGIETVRTHIVQPRCHGNRPWQVGRTRTADELRAWKRDVLEPAVEATRDPDAPLVPGEKQCQFCPAATDCPARQQEALALAQDVFEPETVTDPDKPLQERTPPKLEKLTPIMLATLIEAAPRIRDYLKRAEERATEIARTGAEVPGFKLVQRTGHRKWVDEKEAEQRLTSEGIDPYEKKKLVTPAKAEEALGKRRAQVVAKLAVKPTTGVLLVPVSDKRPAVPSAADVFSKLD